jgi:GT2 family glycosyltransferase
MINIIKLTILIIKLKILMIHIVIPVHNRLSKTIKCIKSLNKQKYIKEINIIIVDDASTDGTKEYLQSYFTNLTIIDGDGSLFWGGAIKLGIQHALKKKKPNDWILIVNNDVELTSKTIYDLVKVSEINKRKSLVIPLSVSANDKKTVIKSGTIVNSWFFNLTTHLFVGKKVDCIKSQEPLKVDIMTGRCVLHPIELFDIVGNYDNKKLKHHGCDVEFSLRVKKFGYSILLCPLNFIYLSDNFQIEKKTIIQKFLYTLFDIRSPSNIINKFYITLRVVPFYAMLSFFFIGIVKSVYLFLKKET